MIGIGNYEQIPSVDKAQYQRFVGKSIYCAHHTRPAKAYAICIVS